MKAQLHDLYSGDETDKIDFDWNIQDGAAEQYIREWQDTKGRLHWRWLADFIVRNATWREPDKDMTADRLSDALMGEWYLMDQLHDGLRNALGLELKIVLLRKVTK